MSYIHSDARGSYRQWWDRQIRTYSLWFAYRHLNIPALDYVPRVPYKYKRSRGWIRPWDVSTSGESAFRQDDYHRKEIDEKEQSRQDWREKKGFRRDKAKHKSCQRHCGRWMKTIVNRENRRAVKNLLKSEKYEQISRFEAPLDTWRWD